MKRPNPWSLLRTLHRLELRTLLGLGLAEAYQPLPALDRAADHRDESTLARWRAIEQELGDFRGSALDIGCNLGFFTLALAERGCLAVGVENERLVHRVCQLQAAILDRSEATFIRGLLDLRLCRNLPRFDVTLFLSVFHHIVREQGLEPATEIARLLLDKTTKVLFFETGQSNETESSWAHCLPAMEPDPRSWITEFFLSLGARDVKVLGDFSTHVSPVDRSLFAIYP